MATAAKIPSPAHMLDGLPPDTRVVIADASWKLYVQLSDAVTDRGCRMAYDGKDLELMGIGPLHDWLASLLAAFVDVVSEELRIACIPMGSTTWKREQVQRGIEADQCYYFDPAKMATAGSMAKEFSDLVADYPNPDLAVEVDISLPRIDRPGIYAALKVSEFWRVRDSKVTISQLTSKGTYKPIAASGFLRVKPEHVERWLFAEDSADRLGWKDRLREWLRAEVLPSP
jgi:Uma2 family endonuclease